MYQQYRAIRSNMLFCQILNFSQIYYFLLQNNTFSCNKTAQNNLFSSLISKNTIVLLKICSNVALFYPTLSNIKI